MFTNQQSKALARLSPLLWPVLFLLLVVYLFPGAPIYYNWDNFAYLDAAANRTHYVQLGFGRTPFVWIGHGLYFLARHIDPYGMFTTFRLWVLLTWVLQAVGIGVVGLTLQRRAGTLAAHLAQLLFICNSFSLELYCGVWPENWSVIFLCFALAAMLAPRRHLLTRWTVSGLFAIMMVLMKEVSVFYIPALVMLMFWTVPRKWGWKWRLLLPALWGILIGMVSLGFFYVIPHFVEGLADARAELMKNHFGQSKTGLGHVFTNIRILSGFLFENIPATVLAGLGLLWALANLARNARARRLVLPALSVALALMIVPMLFVSFTGWDSIMGRYVSVLVPGLAAIAIAGLRAPMPQFLRYRVLGVLLMITATAAVLPAMNWKNLNAFSLHARGDMARYRGMTFLRDQKLAVAVDGDAWPAHFVRFHGGGKGGTAADWAIFWPGYDHTKEWPLPPDWLARQEAQHRSLAISNLLAQNQQVTMEELMQRLGAWEFKPHPSGWWIGTLKEKNNP